MTQGSKVLKWIGKVLGKSAVEVPAGVNEVWASRLEEALSPINELANVRGGLASEMLSYVLSGDPVGVLQDVAQCQEIGNHLCLLGYHRGGDVRRLPDLYEHFDLVPAPVALRWARLLEACVESHKSACVMQFPNGTHWPEVLLLGAAECSIGGWSTPRPKARQLSAERVESLLREDGMEASTLLTVAFATPVTSSYSAPHRLLLVTDLVGYPGLLERHVEAIRPLISPPQVAQRMHVLQMLELADAGALSQLAAELSGLAVCNSRQVRGAADPLVHRCGEAVVGPLRRIAEDGTPDQRAHALRLLARLAAERDDSALATFARETAAADRAPSVQGLITEWESGRAATAGSSARLEVAPPIIDWSPAANAVPPRLLRELWEQSNKAINEANRRSREHHERMRAKGHNFPLHLSEPFTAAHAEALRAYLASDQRTPPARPEVRTVAWNFVSPVIQRLAGADGVTPVALFKLLMFFDLAVHTGDLAHPAVTAMNAIHRRTGRPTLIELSQMMDDAGFGGRDLLRSYCHRFGWALASDWRDEDVWPYFAYHIDDLVQALTTDSTKDYMFERTGLFRAAATLPSLPPELISCLFSLALGPGKTDRLPAQAALAKVEGKEERIIGALADGKAETRAVAAQWLCRLRHADAVTALERAVAKEKHDVAKAAMLDALQALGQPIEKYLNRDALARDAAKTLAKGMPKDLEWFPWGAMPGVRWADSQAAVPTDVLRWLLVQAVKQKQPEPNAILRKYCSMVDARDREPLGQFILETWLREDVKPISAEEARKRATDQASLLRQQITQYPQYFKDSPYLGRSVEEIAAAVLPSFLRQPQGSAIASKGLLAVAAACAAERAAAPTQRYLKEWYGTRASQGKALIAMLAWIEHPTATQLMLSIGSRFRTKSFQEEATRQAQAMAERKGWTLAELADRTMPSAGFDEDGVLELSYGQRCFTARLLSDFKVELFNPDGKKIASLPEPRADDDAEQAAAAKKALSSAKKEIKSIVALQTDRLYEALCTERDWPFGEWNAYLGRHPVVRHLIQRLVWVRFEGGKVLQAFRPLDDGTLTDLDDSEVRVPDDARVRLAHDSLLSPEDVARWQQHLLDYGIAPLFQQLGKGTYSLPPEKIHADEIKDFEGHLLEAFALRGRALKLGYTRGAAEDGGWFHEYAKRFPTLGLEAVLEFTGNPLPEENRTVALLSMYFASTTSGNAHQGDAKLPLSTVPKVLLSECYNDLRLIAAEGSGFDPDWQQKSEY